MAGGRVATDGRRHHRPCRWNKSWCPARHLCSRSRWPQMCRGPASMAYGSFAISWMAEIAEIAMMAQAVKAARPCASGSTDCTRAPAGCSPDALDHYLRATGAHFTDALPLATAPLPNRIPCRTNGPLRRRKRRDLGDRFMSNDLPPTLVKQLPIPNRGWKVQAIVRCSRALYP